MAARVPVPDGRVCGVAAMIKLPVHINDIKVGDTVEHHGVIKTVCACDIGGRKLVTRVSYPRWYRGEQV